ncbi:protein of unknown function [Blastococcus saxobsidens DD2]|uniref:Uncharacterized protein n=1 Tax=Blastococcus saxobsidens (strain DD2) TaxID=1146883 RepID=H6RNN4_BLASD|nr:protein of unknown function [Blastococcus saxobsidens DD2]
MNILTADQISLVMNVYHDSLSLTPTVL